MSATKDDSLRFLKTILSAACVGVGNFLGIRLETDRVVAFRK